VTVWTRLARSDAVTGVTWLSPAASELSPVPIRAAQPATSAIKSDHKTTRLRVDLDTRDLSSVIRFLGPPAGAPAGLSP
jgi:hypothetical protein